MLQTPTANLCNNGGSCNVILNARNWNELLLTDKKKLTFSICFHITFINSHLSKRFKLSIFFQTSSYGRLEHRWETYLRGHSEHLEAGRHVGERGGGQRHVPEVHGERLAPHREVPDVEHRQLLRDAPLLLLHHLCSCSVPTTYAKAKDNDVLHRLNWH